MKYKEFPDGEVYAGDLGICISIRPARYDSNDIYCINRMVSYNDLYSIRAHCRNFAVLELLNAIYDEYNFLNGR